MRPQVGDVLNRRHRDIHATAPAIGRPPAGPLAGNAGVDQTSRRRCLGVPPLTEAVPALQPTEGNTTRRLSFGGAAFFLVRGQGAAGAQATRLKTSRRWSIATRTLWIPSSLALTI